MKRTIASLFCAVSMVSSASAMTGAELLGAGETEGVLFVIGASDVLFQFYIPDLGPAYNAGRLTCGERAGLTAGVLYDVLMDRLRSEPATLTAPASFTLATIVTEICSQ